MLFCVSERVPHPVHTWRVYHHAVMEIIPALCEGVALSRRDGLRRPFQLGSNEKSLPLELLDYG